MDEEDNGETPPTVHVSHAQALETVLTYLGQQPDTPMSTTAILF